MCGEKLCVMRSLCDEKLRVMIFIASGSRDDYFWTLFPLVT